ncbi:MAG: carbohydrate binding domain-containing protein [Caldilineales bacterium]|nr:carbohydrate binding domain-containing protein [Caldilineales bacterium]MDW8319099.1 LamG-like jellyroll fold domain-containing protein [Anaerolineae bacterium]
MLTILVAALVSLSLFSFAPHAPAAPPTCSNPTAALLPDYSYVVGSARFSDPDGDPENGSTFRWLANSSPVAAGPVSEGLLLHFENTAAGANGETPASASGVGYAPGRFGQALALSHPGRLTYSRINNLPLSEGTWEMWVALRANGDDPIYTQPGRWHVLLFYEAANGDDLYIALDNETGVLYAGGTVNGEWQSAYGTLASTRTWQAGQWHHIAFTYSASGNFMRFYVDGRLTADTNEDHYWPPAATSSIFSVGGTPWNAAAHVWLDGVRISGRVADGAEIAARAQRDAPAGPNEVWLPTRGLAPGTSLVYEFTPKAGSQSGLPCLSLPVVYPGIPITNPQPPSTLLPPGSTSFTLSVDTPGPTQCRWAVGAPRPFDQMTPFDSDVLLAAHHSSLAETPRSAHHQSTTPQPTIPQVTHTTTVSGLNPNPNVVNTVTVRCASHPDYLLTLRYRSLSAVNPRFPRTGNLWGYWEFIGKGLPYMARIDLWLGADGLTGEQIATLRTLNPQIRVLTSINAVENNDLSHPACNGCTGAQCDSWYLKDVNGNPIEVWPGSYRINLTKLEVAEYQACYAYQSWIDSGYQADGVFFDNVMTTQSWLTHDIYGNPVQIDANEDGIADDPEQLDAAWKAGVFHEIETFRGLMPHAIVSSHSTDVHEPGIAELFNGISIGFRTANILEGEEGIAEVLPDYQDWLRLAKPPRTTMVESSPIDEIAYGYDYDPLTKIPPSTLEFARTYYPWMRFGLAFTLMDDGYFAHEFGDTHHGNDWWYDELDFDLGYPLGPPRRVPIPGFDPGPNQIVNPGFEQPIAWPWNFWADTASGCAASLSRDTAASAPEGTAAARVNVTATCGSSWRIELAQHNRSLVQGTAYDVTFWARSNVTRTVDVSAQQGSPPWTWYGLDATVEVGPQWREYTVSFEANATVNDARIQFHLGGSTGTVWIDHVRLTLHPPDVFRRDFDNGIVLLNGTRVERTVELGPGFRRLTGSQAPRYETILDDADPGFSVLSGTWQQTGYDSGEWQASGPFYHDWGTGLRQKSSASGAVRWSLPIVASDTYTITVWWPAAPAASGWNSAALYEVVAGGVVVASATLDQRTGGDQWHQIAVVPLAPGQDAHVRLTCTGAPCVADALHLRSVSRYNDGSPAPSVTLAPLDGIVLARVPAVPPNLYLPLITASGAELHWTTDPANCRYDVHRSAAPYFTPSAATVIAAGLPAGANSYLDTGAHIGNPDVEDFYLVRAFGCEGVTTADSQRVGYVDFRLWPGQ